MAAAAFTIAVSASVSAQDPLGGLLMGSNKAIEDSYHKVWAQLQQDGCTRLKARIEAPDALGKGVSAYDTTCTFGGLGTVGVDGSKLLRGTLGLTYAVPDNAVDFRTHTPLGRWADPRFHVTYDLHLVTHLSAVAGVPPLAVDDAVATASNVKVHGGNVTGSLAALFINPAMNESVDLRSAFSDALASNWPHAATASPVAGTH